MLHKILSFLTIVLEPTTKARAITLDFFFKWFILH